MNWMRFWQWWFLCAPVCILFTNLLEARKGRPFGPPMWSLLYVWVRSWYCAFTVTGPLSDEAWWEALLAVVLFPGCILAIFWGFLGMMGVTRFLLGPLLGPWPPDAGEASHTHREGG